MSVFIVTIDTNYYELNNEKRKKSDIISLLLKRKKKALEGGVL